jgi:hypothetical protein
VSAILLAVGLVVWTRGSSPVGQRSGRLISCGPCAPIRASSVSQVTHYHQCDQRVQVIQVFPTMPAPIAAPSPLGLAQAAYLQAFPTTDERELYEVPIDAGSRAHPHRPTRLPVS